MGKGLHRVFKDFVNELSEALPIVGESGSEVSDRIQDSIWENRCV